MTAHPFGTAIPAVRPRLPPAGAILPYLREIDRATWSSSHGPLSRMLEMRLADLWGVAPQEVVLLSSVRSALALSLVASGARRGRRCLMPSWTSLASAGAVVQAGLVPHLVDVCPGTWMPDPAETQALAMRHDVGAVLVVSPFGAPVDMAAWQAVQYQAGVPVVIDAAAAFDTLRAGGPMRPGLSPVAVSLHATKVFGVGQVGALICRDPAVMDRVRRLACFGLSGAGAAQLPGIDAGFSEYGAAVGLAGLDGWAEARTRWHVATRHYLRRLPETAVPLPGFGDGWVAATLNVWSSGTAAEVLAARGVQTRRWWGDGCHAEPGYRGCPAEPLPVTETLARRVVGLPFWQDLTQDQIDHVCAAMPACSPVLAEA